ncbi:EAL domain-containing protein [Xanthobacteraceae bacterium Astr-EGSB]|uniref:putative bifunctional diguanylate cyclase/phosphodiesterase n=1 Tax=Astrobacterium formosum TaxID=3069710 RepID=UPI0027B2A794|nr:EAL domain-containing protein [Xanthobacteraceae bacterium Astr-EGSB]
MTHRLFARQLAKATKADGTLDVAALGALVSAAYDEADHDRSMTDRSIRLMTEELKARHNSLIESEARLSEQNRLFDAALSHMSHGLCMFDAELRLQVCNRRYLEMFGYSPDVVKPGVSLLDIYRYGASLGHYAGDDPEDLFAAARAERPELGRILLRRRLADDRTISMTLHPLADGRWVTTYEDVTDRLRADAKIAHMAMHDALTGLANRASFTAQLDFTIERARVTGDGFTLLCMDLDRFKEINDVFGHAAGDTLLRDLARRLTRACREAYLARVGGDEFMIVAPCTQASSIAALGRRLIEAAAQDVLFEGHRLKVGLSIGSATFPTDGADATALVANADAALYRAKADGRGRIRFFEPVMDLRLREKRDLQQDLQLALERGEFALHFQPQAAIGGEIVGFEALLRWIHPVRGLVPPATFIPVAEECGLILTIGEWVLREVCREAASWPRPLTVSVNISPVQLRHGDLVGAVHAALLETGLSPGRLELELDENTWGDDFSMTLSVLCRLKALGVRVSMDDFGAGYVALSYLQSFPFDKIKIGRAFVADMDRNGQSAAIVRSIAELGRGIGLDVWAQGIEKQSQAAFMADIACTGMQGHLVGRALPIGDYADVIGRPLPVRRKAG